MRVLVIGAGGVGIYFGGRLAQAGAEVELAARGDYDVASVKGYEIDSIAGSFHFKPHRVLKNAADYAGEADYVIVATKVLPTVDRVALLRPAIRSARTVIVLIQNGIDIEREIAEAFPANQLLSTIAYIGASRPAPGRMLHQGGGTLKLGVWPRGISAEARLLSETFAKAEVSCELFDDIVTVRWEKLLWNLPFNPTSVLAGGADTRQMCDGAELERLCSGLMDEVIALANAEGVALNRDMAERQLAYTRDFPAYKTSMLQDYLAGRALEVEAILGNAVRLAARHRLSLPRMESCYALLKSVDRLRNR